MGKKLGIGCGAIVGLLVLFGVIAAVSSGNKDSGVTVASGAPGASAKPSASIAAASPSAKPTVAPTTPPAKPTATPVPKIGDEITKGNWSYKVTKASRMGDHIDTGNQFIKLDALGSWLAVYMTLANVGKQNFPINRTDFEIQDAAGVKSNPTTHIVEMDFWLTQQKLKKLGEQIPPGVSFDTAILFDVNPSASGLRLNLKQAQTLVDLGI